MPGKPLTVLFVSTQLLLLSVPVIAVAEEAAKGSQEPPQLFYLELGGKKVPLELNKPFNTVALSGNNTATLRVEPYRVFQNDGIRFHYPREYTFEAVSIPGMDMWTLSGTSAVLMIQKSEVFSDADATRRDVLKAMMAQYKNATVEESDITLKVKEATLKGTRLEVNVVGTDMRQDLYSVPLKKGVMILIIQDTPNANGEASADKVQAEKLLCETLQLPKD